jgi:hypothetical protein
MADDRKAVEGAIDYAILQAGAAPSSRIGAAGWIQGVGYDWLQGQINSGSSLGSRGSILNKLIQGGFGASFIAPFNDLGNGQVDTSLLVGTGSATFTRATTATTVNSSGTIVSVASGVARSYYDPTTLAYMAYLAEGARTNLHPASADMTNASYWSATRASWPGTTIAAPDGASTGQKLVEDSTAANTHLGLSFGDVTVVNATTYTTSVFAKAGERTWFALQEGQGVTATAYFNLSSGAVGTVSGTGTPSATIKAYPNGWYRCTLTWTASGVAARIRLFLSTGDTVASYSGDGTSGAYFWGAQLEAGSFASTYIPTTTASVVRNADVLTYPSSGNVSATEGTFYAETQFFGTASSASANDHAIVEASDGTANNRFTTLRQSSSNTEFFSVFNGGINQAVPTSGTLANNTNYKVGSAYKLNSFYTAQNGTLSSVDSSGSVPAVTTIYVGCGNAGNQAFGTLRNVRIYQTQLSASQLTAITQ